MLSSEAVVTMAGPYIMIDTLNEAPSNNHSMNGLLRLLELL